MPSSRLTVCIVLLLTVLASGCVLPVPADTMHGEGMDGHSEDGHGEGMDMERMNIGDPEATPADAIPGAVLRQGTWLRLVTAPEAYADVTGTAQLAVHDQRTTVTLRLAQLPPEQSYMVHVHVDTCRVLGGDHFRFDPEGSDMPPNEIHLAFNSQADGTGFVTVENPHAAGEEARSIVIHQMADDLKLLCADLESE